MAVSAAGGYGDSGRRRFRRLAEGAVDGLVAMAAVMDAMNGCMRPANAAAESSTAGFASVSKSTVPGLIAAGSAAGSCLLRPLIFSVFMALLSDGWSDKLLYSAKGRRSSAKR